MTAEITKKQCFDIWTSNAKNERIDAVLAFILGHYPHLQFSEGAINEIKFFLRRLFNKFNEKWSASGRHRERFLNKNLIWLNEYIKLPDNVLSEIPSTSGHSPGRPPKSFIECCDKTKKRKVQNLLSSTSPEEITIAHECNLRKAGKRDSAAIVKELSMSSPKRGSIIKSVRKEINSERVQKTLSADEALSMMVDANLSTHQYDIIRQRINKLIKNLLPSYDRIKEAKKKCYPSNKTVTESTATCDLQSLVDHSIKRLCMSQKEVLVSIEYLQSGVKELSLLIKWGCDGAQQKAYKQKFSSETKFDENLFSTSMVPIQLRLNVEGNLNIVWQNPAPSSTRYCRPIRLNFAKETTSLIKEEVDTIQRQIDMLSPVEVSLDSFKILVKPIFMLTMIDGKICSAVSDVSLSSQTCYICGAKPSEMNKPSLILMKPLDQTALSFGLSPLHSWIRFMECILHIAYKLDIKLWQARGQENKDKVQARKTHIQTRFRNELGLLVDLPTQQAGNTNDGNTARRFFRNATVTADITGVNLELIKRFHIILETLGCGFSVCLDSFNNYTEETRNLYLREYSWYNMPVSVHKVLFHGRDVIASCVLPIGQLSEEAQEARNKDNRRYREFFTRKTSRIDTNTDLLNRLLISSDPLISSYRIIMKRKQSPLEPEVLNLLSMPTVNEAEIEVSD